MTATIVLAVLLAVVLLALGLFLFACRRRLRPGFYNACGHCQMGPQSRRRRFSRAPHRCRTRRISFCRPRRFIQPTSVVGLLQCSPAQRAHSPGSMLMPGWIIDFPSFCPTIIHSIICSPLTNVRTASRRAYINFLMFMSAGTS